MFEQLRNSSVDPNMVGGERGKTLFDFVDAETVQSLQQDALDQTKEYERMKRTLVWRYVDVWWCLVLQGGRIVGSTSTCD